MGSTSSTMKLAVYNADIARPTTSAIRVVMAVISGAAKSSAERQVRAYKTELDVPLTSLGTEEDDSMIVVIPQAIVHEKPIAIVRNDHKMADSVRLGLVWISS